MWVSHYNTSSQADLSYESQTPNENEGPREEKSQLVEAYSCEQTVIRLVSQVQIPKIQQMVILF